MRNLLALGVLAAVLAWLVAPTASFAQKNRRQGSTAAGKTVRRAPARHATVKPAASKHRTSKRSRRVRQARGQRAPEAARIREIQQALIDRGHLARPATGSWDDRAVEAMRRFQSENGLDATGKFDAPSLIKLGLGPPTAGVGAPREIASTQGNNNHKNSNNEKQ